DGPVLFVEHKILYNTDICFTYPQVDDGTANGDLTCTAAPSPPGAPAYLLTVRHGEPARLTIATYGYGAELARQALVRLAYEFEVFAEVVVISQLAPCDMAAINSSIRRTGRLLTLEEGTRTLGWGAEVLARTLESGDVRAAVRLAADDVALPAAGPLELAVLPGVDDLVKAAAELSAR
ncbi:MAG: transketolase C-terminal domain-containing protein, partial [Pseudonocardiaceae bacterium]